MRLSSKLAVAFSFPIALATDCSENNCLRAIQNTSTRPALADCNSFLQKTVTPSAVTVTATATVTKSFVETIVPIESATKTEYFTETDTVSRTTIAFETYVVSQTTVTGTETVTSVEYLTNIAKRQQTSVPTAIPAYASPCSGAVKYSSACSCIGATRTTITAATPTLTVTVTATQSSTVKETASTLMTVWATKSFTDSKTITTVETSTQGTSTTTTINAIQTDTALVHYELVSGPGPNNCLYNAISNSDANQGGFDESKRRCEQFCSANPKCKLWSASFYAPGGGTFCSWSESSFNPSLLNCQQDGQERMVIYEKFPSI